jgi:hypothetical protein
MSVRETDEIDYIYLEEPARRPVLVVSDPLGWKPPEEKQHLELLRLKLNSQIVFIASGQIEKVWPDWSGDDKALVEVAARHALTKRAEDFYLEAEEVLDEAGISLRFMLLE